MAKAMWRTIMGRLGEIGAMPEEDGDGQDTVRVQSALGKQSLAVTDFFHARGARAHAGR